MTHNKPLLAEQRLADYLNMWSREAKGKQEFFDRILSFLNDEKMQECLREDLGSHDPFFLNLEESYRILNAPQARTRNFLILANFS